MALSYRAASAVANVASGDLTLTEPAGTLPGDLLVATIAYRSNAPFTTPIGWTFIRQENTGDIVAASTGISSIYTAYCVRQAGPPALLFARPGVGDVARGYITGYTPGAGGVPTLDTSSSATLGAGSVSLVVPAITTTQANCLLIGCCSGVRGNGSPNWSAQTTTSAHTERVDTSTTVGADLSVAVSDMQQASAGSTGNFTATAVFSGLHCGALLAFYETAPGTAAVIANSQGSVSVAGTSHTVTLPTGLVAGNLCVIIGGGAGTNATWPAGWTEFAEITNMSLAYRFCDGSEGSTITVTTAASVTPSFIAHRITGAHATTPPEGVAFLGGTVTNPDTPALVASWWTDPTLWIATCRTASGTITGYPAGYTNNQIQTSDGLLASASRVAQAAGEDPGTWVGSNTSGKQTATIAVRPATVAANPTNNPVPVSAVSGTGASGTSHAITLPSLSAGDLCIAIINGATTATAITWPAGWNEIADTGGAPPVGIAYRWCDGTEGATVTVTTSVAITSTSIATRITGAHATTPPEQIVSAAVASTSLGDPPGLVASWGLEANLWLAACASSTVTSPQIYPQTYALVQTVQGNTGNLAFAGHQLSAYSDDPAAFDFGAGSATRRSMTIAVRPAAAAAVTGTVDQTTGIAAQDASGTVTAAGAISGTVAQTLSPAQQAATGTVTAAPAVSGTVDQTLSPAQQAATGTVTAAGAISGTIAQITTIAAQAATGTVTAAPAITGAVIQAIQPAQQAATGTVAAAGTIVGTIDQTITRTAQAATGTVTAAPAVTGTIAQTLQPAQQAATGVVAAPGNIVGTIAQTTPSATQAAVGFTPTTEPTSRVGGGFANWSKKLDKRRREAWKEAEEARQELRRQITRLVKGEPEERQEAKTEIREAVATIAEARRELEDVPELAGFRRELRTLEGYVYAALDRERLRQAQAERLMLQLAQVEALKEQALMALQQEEEAIVALLA